MAKTRRQKKRGGAEEYVYGLYINDSRTHPHDIHTSTPSIVYKHLDVAYQKAVEYAREKKEPRHELDTRTARPEDIEFDKDGFSKTIAKVKGMHYLFTFVRRYKVSSEASRAEMRMELGKIAKKTGISPDSERTIAEMVGVKGF